MHVPLTYPNAFLVVVNRPPRSAQNWPCEAQKRPLPATAAGLRTDKRLKTSSRHDAQRHPPRLTAAPP